MFYIIEKQSQLSQLSFGDCFVRFIPNNSNFHPTLTNVSLVYVRPIEGRKGYVLCVNHNESLSLGWDIVQEWLLTNTGSLWVLNKKQSMHWFPHGEKLYDVNLINPVDLDKISNKECIDYYYKKYPNLPNINALIPISKHYEESELIFGMVQNTIKNFEPNDQFNFQNSYTSDVFYRIEKNGVKVDKNCFISYYRDKLHFPEFNLFKGKIYSQYNLYNVTSRPSNVYNSINFAALNKENGERQCYIPENDRFIEIDFQGYHPRLIGELIGFDFPEYKNTYEYLGWILGVSKQEAKELTFKQLYGGVWEEYKDKPFFKNVASFTQCVWLEYQAKGLYSTDNKIFIQDKEMTPSKLFNYIVQSYETSTNVKLLKSVLSFLEDKKTKLVLYTYDAFLFDYSEEDGDILTQITNLLQYPVGIKQGKTYHGLEKI